MSTKSNLDAISRRLRRLRVVLQEVTDVALMQTNSPGLSVLQLTGQDSVLLQLTGQDSVLQQRAMDLDELQQLTHWTDMEQS